MPDAAPAGECDHLRVVETADLGDGNDVTARLTLLPGGDVGIVYVGSGRMELTYERRGIDLTPRGAPVVVASDTFTWGEIAPSGDRLAIVYGSGGAQSTVREIDYDGARLGSVAVPLEHPSLFIPNGERFLWAAFAMHAENSLVIASVTPNGDASSPVSIDMGLYGSGHGAVAAPDGSFVVGYPREGDVHGTRRPYLAAVARDGTLVRELLLADTDAHAVLPLRVGDALVVARIAEEEVVLARFDWTTLEPIAERTYPGLGYHVYAVGGDQRFAIARVESEGLTIDAYDADLEPFDSVVAPLPPGRGNGTAGDAIAWGNELVFSNGTVAGAESYPWLVHVTCEE